MSSIAKMDDAFWKQTADIEAESLSSLFTGERHHQIIPSA